MTSVPTESAAVMLILAQMKALTAVAIVHANDTATVVAEEMPAQNSCCIDTAAALTSYNISSIVNSVNHDTLI